MFKRKSTKRKIQNLVDAQCITMSSIDDREDHGVINPETLDTETSDEKCILAYTKNELNFLPYLTL